MLNSESILRKVLNAAISDRPAHQGIETFFPTQLTAFR